MSLLLGLYSQTHATIPCTLTESWRREPLPLADICDIKTSKFLRTLLFSALIQQSSSHDSVQLPSHTLQDAASANGTFLLQVLFQAHAICMAPRSLPQAQAHTRGCKEGPSSLNFKMRSAFQPWTKPLRGNKSRARWLFCKNHLLNYSISRTVWEIKSCNELSPDSKSHSWG